MIHRLLLLFALAIIPFISPAQERVEVKDPEIKFSYLLPDGWEVKDDGYDYQIHSPGFKNAYVSITYVENAQGSEYVESLGAKPSFEEDFDFELRYILAEDYPNFKVIEKGSAVIEGVPARWARFRSGSNGDRAGVFYMYQKLNQTFKITGISAGEDFEKIQPFFNSIIQSLKSSKI